MRRRRKSSQPVVDGRSQSSVQTSCGAGASTAGLRGGRSAASGDAARCGPARRRRPAADRCCRRSRAAVVDGRQDGRGAESRGTAALGGRRAAASGDRRRRQATSDLLRSRSCRVHERHRTRSRVVARRLEAQGRAHRARVEPAAVRQEAICSGEKSASPRAAHEPRADGRRTAGSGTATVARRARRTACDSMSTPSPATLNVPWRRASDGDADGLEPVVLVHELQPGVEARAPSGTTGSEKYAVMGGLDPRADEVGEAQRGDRDVGAAAGEAAHVRLDLDGVLRPARRRRRAWAPCPR